MNYIIILFMIGLLILIHELGHFLAARWKGIPIARFSVGFGPVIWMRKKGETEYCLSLIPLGGYVLPAIEDENEFFSVPVFKRIILSLGGPAANIILSVFIYIAINLYLYGFSFNAVLIKPFMQSVNIINNIVVSLSGLFDHQDQISGIIGIVYQGKNFIGSDILKGLNFMAILSLNLAVFNMLPIPALDGGKILLYLLEKLHHKLARLHIPLSIGGWVCILGLMIYATYLDVEKYIIKLFF